MSNMNVIANFAAESMILTILRSVESPVDVSLIAQFLGIVQQRSAKKRQYGYENLEMVLRSLEERGRIVRDLEGKISVA